MKPILKFLLLLLLLTIAVLQRTSLHAQICSNSVDTVYGLDLAGNLRGINVNNAGVGAIAGTTGPSPANLGINSNGIGYSSLYGKFYLFNRCATGIAGDTTQFVSYNPATGVTTVLADPPSTFTKTMKIRSGCVNNLGSGYYTINPNLATAALYYYDIATNTWTTVCQNWKDQTGASINADITGLNSGDMAFDGSGDLWILASNSTQYALYEIKNPVPTSGPVTITCVVKIPKTATPSSAAGSSPTVSFTGLAFNSAGKMVLASGGSTTTITAYHNVLYTLSAVGSSLVQIGTMANDVGGDLTSCVYPTGVLPLSSNPPTAPARATGHIYIGPNPARDKMFIFGKDNASNYLAQVFDHSGRLVYYTMIEPSQQSINIGKLHEGPYLLKLTSSTHEVISYQFIKW